VLNKSFCVFVCCVLICAFSVLSERSYARDGRPVITVKDALGRTVELYRFPKRIVSTVPSNTELLYDLGLKDKVIAVTKHCKKTCDIAGKEIIGGWADPAIADKIARLKPDLVLAFGGLQTPLAEELEKKGIPVFVFFPRTVDETLEQILLVGALTDTKACARRIVLRCRKNLRKIERRWAQILPLERPRCLRLMSTQAMVIGKGSFQSDIIARAGGRNVFEDIREDYPVVSLEEVRRRDPDVIILNRDDTKTACEWFMRQEGWNQLRAARSKRIFSISCDYICHPNSRIDKTVRIIHEMLYGKGSG